MHLAAAVVERARCCARCRAASASRLRRARRDAGALALARSASSASPFGLDVDPVLLASACGNPLLATASTHRCHPSAARPRRRSPRRRRCVPEDLDLLLGGQLNTAAVCGHQFLHCLDGVLQPLGLIARQEPMLAAQVRHDVDVGSSSRARISSSGRPTDRYTSTRCSRSTSASVYPRVARRGPDSWAPLDRCGRSGAACARRHR